MHNGLDQHLKFLVNTFYNQDQTSSIEQCWEKILINFFPDTRLEKQAKAIEISQLSDNNERMLVPVMDSNVHYQLSHKEEIGRAHV